jgi:hypothetical protein
LLIIFSTNPSIDNIEKNILTTEETVIQANIELVQGVRLQVFKTQSNPGNIFLTLFLPFSSQNRERSAVA